MTSRPRFAVGSTVSISRTIGESDVYLFGGLTGDLGPNHMDEEYSKKTAYGRRVVHGAYLVGAHHPRWAAHPPAPRPARAEQGDQVTGRDLEDLLQRPHSGQRFGWFGTAFAALPVAQASQAHVESAVAEAGMQPAQTQATVGYGHAQHGVEGSRHNRTMPARVLCVYIRLERWAARYGMPA